MNLCAKKNERENSMTESIQCEQREREWEWKRENIVLRIKQWNSGCYFCFYPSLLDEMKCLMHIHMCDSKRAPSVMYDLIEKAKEVNKIRRTELNKKKMFTLLFKSKTIKMLISHYINPFQHGLSTA